LVRLAVERLSPNPHQPRQQFDDASLAELAASIKQSDLMQPVVVRRVPRGTPGSEELDYQLIAGERRWRAAQLAGLESIPAIVHDLDDQSAAEWALVENLQREDLNPLEKARAFEQLQQHFGLDQQKVADRVGLARSTVANLLRLLALPAGVQQLVEKGTLSMGHARVLAGVDDADRLQNLADSAAAEGWSVRELERRSQDVENQPAGSATRTTRGASADESGPNHLTDLSRRLSEQLGTRVKVKRGRKKGSGTLSIEFFSLDEFDGLLQRLGVSAD
jgi:ParB family chromosome partitioning protein